MTDIRATTTITGSTTLETTKRQPTKSARRAASGKKDLRLLFAAASVAATMGGAGLFASRDSSGALPQPAAPAGQAQASAPAALPEIAPLPTLVPAPNNGATTGTDSGVVAAAPPAAPTATPVQSDLPVVTVPRQRQWPPPMAITRSSR